MMFLKIFALVKVIVVFDLKILANLVNTDLTMRQRQRRRQPQSTPKGLERGVAVAVHVVVNFPYDRVRLKNSFSLSGVQFCIFFMIPNIRDALLLSHDDGFLDVDDCMLLYEIYKPKSPNMCYRKDDKFCICKFSDDECKNNFRFYRNDIYHLHEVMQLPLEVSCNNGVQVDGIEALCIFLMRFAYPCRFADLVPTFGRPIPQLCMITNEVINFTYQQWGHLLSTLDQPWLSPHNLQLFADAVHSQGGLLMEQSDQYLDQGRVNVYFTMVINEYMQ